MNLLIVHNTLNQYSCSIALLQSPIQTKDNKIFHNDKTNGTWYHTCIQISEHYVCVH